MRVFQIIVFVLLHFFCCPFLWASTLAAGKLCGKVVDAETGQPVGFVFLLIDEIHFWRQVGADGQFCFENMPAGLHAIRTFRLGYREAIEKVFIQENQITEVIFKLYAKPISIDDVSISAHRIDSGFTLYHPAMIVSDRKLLQNLGMTIAKTIENEPGLDRITMGPAPARPVLRGMAGDRLLLLEDGERTGDLSATSADHAVSIEPITATRIEVVRGPEALTYGSNALAGVINIVREAVPRTAMTKRSGAITLQSESVNHSVAAAVEGIVPIGPLIARIDASLRSADDMKTPSGTLKNTCLRSGNGSTGMSLVQKWGHLGVAAGLYDSEYGIPPDPLGGHPSGVDITMQRHHAIIQGEWNVTHPAIRHLFGKYQLSRYRHQEYESTGVLGMEFGVVTQNATAIIHFDNYGFLHNARLGFWGEYRNYASAGLNFTPATKEYSGAAYLYNEWQKGRWSVNGTIRVDIKSVHPQQEYFSTRVGRIRPRHFGGCSAAFAGHYHLQPHWMIGGTLMRSFRAPSVEELFSEGPHLAAYCYEVGNANLDQEKGYTMELFNEYSGDKNAFRMAVFYNDMPSFIFPRNTGERSLRRADLFLYRYQGLHARLTGFEMTFKWLLVSWFSLAAQSQFVYGQNIDEARPLPRIPPLSAKIDLSFHRGPMTILLQSKGSARQNRLDQFERPTDGYLIHDLHVQYIIQRWGMLHTISLTVENVENREYRRHLNRIKEIMPEPGRNLRLSYKTYF